MKNIFTIYLMPARSGELGYGESAGGGLGISTNRNTRNRNTSSKPSSAALAQAQALANAQKAAANQPTGSRIVNIVGTANDNLSRAYSLIQPKDAESLEQKVTLAFDLAGWIFASPMEFVWDSGISMWRFRIVANVHKQYDHNSIIQEVRSIFLNLRFTDWISGFGTYQPFTTVTAFVERDTKTTVSATPYIPQSNNSGANTNPFGGDFKLPGSDFLTTLANSLGVSTAVAGAALIVFAAIILKR